MCVANVGGVWGCFPIRKLRPRHLKGNLSKLSVHSYPCKTLQKKTQTEYCLFADIEVVDPLSLSLSRSRSLPLSPQEGFNPGNMRPWRLHWDHQLYKSLEHQYQLGMEALNEHLPEIKVELVYR